MSKADSCILFGGTFNPFTIAHLEMVKRLRADFPQGDIVIMPTNLAFIKHWKDLPGGAAFSGEDRVRIIRETVTGIPGCVVSDEEATGRLSGKSYDTVLFLKNLYENVYMCVGTDKLLEMLNWYHSKELMEKLSGIIVFDRGDTIPKEFPKPIIPVKFDMAAVSSTRVRELYEMGRMAEIEPLVPGTVYTFLKEMRERT